MVADRCRTLTAILDSKPAPQEPTDEQEKQDREAVETLQTSVSRAYDLDYQPRGCTEYDASMEALAHIKRRLGIEEEK